MHLSSGLLLGHLNETLVVREAILGVRGHLPKGRHLMELLPLLQLSRVITKLRFVHLNLIRALRQPWKTLPLLRPILSPPFPIYRTENALVVNVIGLAFL